jgi:hypothetical protein
MIIMRMQTLVAASAVCLYLVVTVPVVSAQRGDAPPQVPARVVVSPELQGRQVTLRIRAPEAKAVRLNGGGMVATGGNAMTKDADGVWEITVGPLIPARTAIPSTSTDLPSSILVIRSSASRATTS